MGPTAEAPRPQFRVLGPLEVVVADEQRPVPGDKLQALLVRLLLERNRPVTAERLVDDLWGDHAPATARQSLHAHVGRLRRLLSGDGAAVLGNDGRGYVLRVADEQYDASRFRELVAAARGHVRAGEDAAARVAYRQALALWRGSAFDGVPLEAAEGERLELEELRLAVLEERIDLDLADGSAAAEVVPELQQLVQREPLRERLWGQLMVALYASGRQAEALQAYQNARRALAAIGLELSPRLRQLEQQILNQDCTLPSLPGQKLRTRTLVLRRRGLAAVAAAAAVAGVVGTVVALRNDPPQAAESPPVVVRPNSLVEIDPTTNRVVSSTTVGSGPEGIASSDDALWVANIGDRTVARIGLRDRNVRVLGGAPVARDIAGAMNGDVWLSSFEEPFVTMIAARGHIAEDPHAVAAGPLRIRLPGSAEALAIGGGFLWVTSPSDSGGRDAVFLIDLRSRRVVSSIRVGALPLFVAFGYGAAWVSNYRGDSVSVIRPGTDRVETIPVRGGPLGVAAGDGAVWVVTFWSRELVRIDPESRSVTGRIRIGRGPLRVAVGAGAVWVTNRDDRTVTRVDPHTNAISRTIRLAAPPYGIRVAHGRVWVTTQRCGSEVVPCGRSND